MNRSDSKTGPPQPSPHAAGLGIEVDDEATNITSQSSMSLLALKDIDPDETTVSPGHSLGPEVEDSRDEPTTMDAAEVASWARGNATDTVDQPQEPTDQAQRDQVEAPEEPTNRTQREQVEVPEETTNRSLAPEIEDEGDATSVTDRASMQFMRAPSEEPTNLRFNPDTLDTDDVTAAADVPDAAAIAQAIVAKAKEGASGKTPPPGGTLADDPIPSLKGAKAAFAGIPGQQRGGDAEASARDDALIGTVLLERYEVVRRIGMGGMSMVYLGRHTTIGKQVAIKVLAPQLAEWPVYVERFLQEARAASMISHPNVVDITDFGYTEGERLPFFVMEYLQGEDLRQRLGRERRLPWAAARPITLQICSALEAAHRNGVIHRDIKPENCFVIDQEDGTQLVKLLDFGIAKVASDTEPGTLTSHGVVLGTVDYISPERANKENVDARADIYSLGVLLYRIVVGKTPFQGDAVEVVTAHVYRKPPLPSRVAPDAEIAPELEAIIMRALAKKPDQRFQSVSELSAALQSVPVPGLPMSAVYQAQQAPSVPPMPLSSVPGMEAMQMMMPGQPPVHGYQPYPPPQPTNRKLMVVLSLVVILLVVIAVLLATQDDGAEPPPTTPTGSAPASTTQ